VSSLSLWAIDERRREAGWWAIGNTTDPQIVSGRSPGGGTGAVDLSAESNEKSVGLRQTAL